jgi:hypothetical protein
MQEAQGNLSFNAPLRIVQATLFRTLVPLVKFSGRSTRRCVPCSCSRTTRRRESRLWADGSLESRRTTASRAPRTIARIRARTLTRASV